MRNSRRSEDPAGPSGTQRDPAGPSDDPANDRATAGSNDGPSDRARPRAPRRGGVAGSPGREGRSPPNEKRRPGEEERSTSRSAMDHRANAARQLKE